MQVIVENPNTIIIDVDQGRQGRGISNITYTEVSGQYFLIVTYTDGTTETLGPLVVTGGAAFLLGGATGSIPYQSAPNTTVFLPIGTQNQVVVAGATTPQYTSALTGLTVNNSAIGNTTPSTGAFTNLSASGTFALTGDQVQISEGGTGQTTANAAFNALAPSQTGNTGKYLKTDGTNAAWDQLDISTADITGTLPIANGGTGQTTANSALNALLPVQAAQSGKYLKTDGTNASWDQLDISTADITGILPVVNGGTGASTAPGARANLSAAVLGTNNDITSLTGITGGISTPDFVQFDTTATEANAVGKVYWDASQGTLDLGLLGGNVISRIGQSLVAYVTNAEAVTITKGQAVYLFSAQGDRATVKLAYNTSDATSAKTFGVVAENITANGTGFVMCQGVLEGLNLGAFAAGDTLYLGATPGSLTATKPYAPNHLVYVGLVERANAGNGQLYVKVQNGYELDEIHNVQIVSPQNGQTILYDASTSLWKNANLTAGTGVSVTNGAASVTIGNTGVLSFSGGTTGLTPATSTTGAVTLGGTLAVASGGTGATTAGGALTNLGAASSAITISAGTGLTGGGDLTANRTLSIANTAVTPAAYGSASSVGTFTVNAQGQLTAAASTPIAIANTQVSGLGTMSTQNSNSVTITGGSITGITDLAIADGGTGASDAPTARTNLGLGTSATLNAGVALGVATLDAGGTVPLTQLPASIQGGVSYQGSWNAATNTPTITSGVGSKGYYYVVSVAGSTNIDGITDWLPGDWIIYNGTVWQKIDNTDAVASVNGYTGVVVLSAADVGAPPTSRTITAGTGLTGGGDLSANRTISIANTTVSAGAYGSASSVGTFTVNGQGQLTAAASTPIAITNTQVSGLGTMSTQNASAVAITGGTVDGTAIGGTTRSTGAFTTLTLTNALSVANGGTGTTTSTGTGSVVLSSSPTLTTPNLGTPSAVTLTNGTGLPLTTGVTGTLPILNGGTGQTTANAAFNALVPSQTGNSGKYLTTDGSNTSWATNPLGTVTSVDVSGGTTGLTTSGGPITTSGTITLAGTLAVANGGTGITAFGTGVATALGQNVTGSGGIVLAASPSLTTPNLGTPSAATLTNATGLPISTGVSGLGTGVATALAVNTGSAGAFVVNGGALGTPSSGTVTNLTGTASININGTVGATTPTTGAFTTLTTSGAVTHNGGTANGVAYLNGSKVLTTGSALTFDGTNLGVGAPSPQAKVHALGSGSGAAEIRVQNTSSSTDSRSLFRTYSNASTFGGSLFMTGTSDSAYPTSALCLYNFDNLPLVFGVNNTEAMRLTSTGLGIGTSSPAYKLDVAGDARIISALNFGSSALASAAILTQSNSQNAQTLIFGNAYSFNTDGGGGMVKASDTLYLVSGGGTGSATLNSSGNLGLGVTPYPTTGGGYGSGSYGLLQIQTPGSSIPTGDSNVPAGRAYAQISGGAYASWLLLRGPYSNTAGKSGILLQDTFYDNGGYGGRYIQAVDQALVFGRMANGTIYSSNGALVEQARIDSSGNLGLGVTPSAWDTTTTSRAMQIGRGGALFYSTAEANMSIGVNYYQDTATTYKYLNASSSPATRYAQSDFDGAHKWYTAPSGTAGNAISFTQAMTLDASGNLGIGTTSPFYRLSVRQPTLTATLAEFRTIDGTNNPGLEIRTSTAGTTLAQVYSSGATANLLFETNSAERARITSGGDLLVGTTGSSSARLYVRGSGTTSATASFEASNSSGATRLYVQDDGTTRFFGSAGSETARITSDGNLLVGTTTFGQPDVDGAAIGKADGAFRSHHATGTASGTIHAYFTYGGLGIGSITQSGTTAVLYNTTSDQRLKTNIVDAPDASALIDSIKVRSFDWISDESHQRYGMVAQELALVAPEAVHAPADPDDMMAVDYSKLVPMLIKEIQSLRARVAQLEAK